MVGMAVLTESDCMSGRNLGSASVGLGSYAFDVHPVEIVPVQESPGAVPVARVEGCPGGAHPPGPYEIPYAALTPQRRDAANLLVPVALSASHVAFASVRVELTWSVLGHSAGTAAALASRNNCTVQDVDPGQLHDMLLAQGQVLHRKQL